MSKRTLPEITLGDAVTDISRGIQLTAAQLENCITDEETGYLYLSLADIKEGLSLGLNVQQLRNFDPSRIDKDVDRFCIRRNTVLLTKNDTPFKVAIAGDTAGKKVVAAGNIYMITADEDKVIPRWLCYWLQSPEGMRRLREAASLTNGGKMKWISKKQIESISIPLLTFKEQTELLEQKLIEYSEWINRITQDCIVNFGEILEIFVSLGLACPDSVREFYNSIK
ncbi:MAG: hypothetical protein ACI4KM_01170 [Oscillospiraceae bacterium]